MYINEYAVVVWGLIFIAVVVLALIKYDEKSRADISVDHLGRELRNTKERVISLECELRAHCDLMNNLGYVEIKREGLGFWVRNESN